MWWFLWVGVAGADIGVLVIPWWFFQAQKTRLTLGRVVLLWWVMPLALHS